MADNVIRQLLELRRRFDALHDDGMAALRDGDYARLALNIRKEGQIIEQQGRLLESFMQETANLPRRRLKKVKEA